MACRENPDCEDEVLKEIDMTDKMKLSKVRQIYGMDNVELTQDELIEWLTGTANHSWDIPSALGMICSHLDIDAFPMHHRDWADPKEYPSLASYVMADNAQWDILDHHFAQEHSLDLTDERINWSFDT